MWRLINHTPFPAHAGFLRDHTGQSWWQIWLKGSFDIPVGRAPRFAATQTPLHLGPVYADDNPAGLLLADTDLAHHKPRVDLTIHAQATPDPNGPRDLRFALGSWQKTIRLYPSKVWGDWRSPLRPDPSPSKDPVTLDWRAAAGGVDMAVNPLGQWQDRPAQVVYPNDKPNRKVLPSRAAGLGAIPPHWPQRSQHGGTYDQAWEQSRAPLLPTDFDPAFWQTAPEDQQLPRTALQSTELLVEGLDGAGDTRSYALPAIDLDMQTKIGTTWHKAPHDAQALHLDLVAGRATVTYAARWPIARAAADVDIARSVVMLGRRNTYRVSAADMPAYRKNAQGEIA